MPKQKLEQALAAINWQANLDGFLNDELSTRLANAILELATWAHQIEEADTHNPALSFVREMQISGQNVAVLLSLGLYKPAASAMRTAMESALYYTYFRDHPVELATLNRDPEYYISKSDIVKYHEEHTKRFKIISGEINLNGPLMKWYSEISAIVHGQIPGAWNSYTSIRDIKYSERSLSIAVDKFVECQQIVGKLFLATIAPTLWRSFSTPAKEKFLHGMPGKQKAMLGLDRA